MEVAVLGGGHGCYAAAADASEAGQNVRFWRRDAAAFRDVAERRALTILDANGRRDVPLTMVTDDIAAYMGGGPAMAYSAKALEAYDEFSE